MLVTHLSSPTSWIAAVALLLSGCTLGPFDADRPATSPPPSSMFDATLSRAYVALGDQERAECDWPDTARFYQRAIDVAVDRDDALLPLNVDGAVLYQVLQNLLSNAIKFSASGASVQLRTFRDADGAIGVSVRDQGVGIPAELIDKVTQPFWQRQGPLVHDHDGVGLGLAIVKSHVDALGGELRFDSQVGRGTTATVLLPVSRTIRPS